MAPAHSACAPTSRSRAAKSRKSAKSPTAASETIDASDLIVSPGFVDPHTHYDAQICWDPLVTCTSWHGVTSVVMGNCGVGIAPCKPEVREIAAWDLVNVEAIPFDALSKGITWEWETLSRVHGRGANARQRDQPRLPRAADAVSPFRDGRGIDGARGDARRDRRRSPGFCDEAVAAGAFGFSTTTLPQHIGYQGTSAGVPARQPTTSSRPTPTCCSELGKGAIEVALTRRAGRVSEDEVRTARFPADESGRPVTWLAMASRADNPEASARHAAGGWSR